MVATAVDKAKRIPEPPPLPTDYRSLLLDVSEWIEALQGVAADVAATQQQVQQGREENVAAAAETEEDIYDAVWHRIAWLM
jgi:hypothetical protein